MSTPTPNTSPSHRARASTGVPGRMRHVVADTWASDLLGFQPCEAQPATPAAPLSWREAGLGRLSRGARRIFGQLTSSRLAQLQGSVSLVTGLWGAAAYGGSMLQLPLWGVVGTQLLAGALLWRLSQHSTAKGSLALVGVMAAAASTLYAGAKLQTASVVWPVGLEVAVQMAFAGWWCAWCAEGGRAERVDPSHQPRPGRPLYS